MGNLNLKVAHDGARNAAIQITGLGPSPEGWKLLIDLTSLEPTPHKVKVDAVYSALSRGVEMQLAWEGEKATLCPLLSLEGRGRIDFGEVSGLANQALVPTGNILYRIIGATKESMYSVVLDLSKHIGEPK